MKYEWDPAKEMANRANHGVDFIEAQKAFQDPKALVLFDVSHSSPVELRWWLLGKVGPRVLTVRYTHRPMGIVRLIGAGYWREGHNFYETYWEKYFA